MPTVDHISGNSPWNQFLRWWMGLSPIKYMVITNLIMIGLGMLMTPVMMLAGLDLDSDLGGPDFEDLGIPMIVATAVIVAPLIETVIFQWPILYLKKFTWLWPLIFFSSAFFALAHIDYSIWYALIVFPMGLVLALTIVYYRHEKMNGFWMTVLVHAFRNALAMIPIIFFPDAL